MIIGGTTTRSSVHLYAGNSPLLNPRAQGEAVGDNGDEGDQVEQRREAMDLAKLLVEGRHLLGVRRRIIALLAVFRLCDKVGVSRSFHPRVWPTPAASAHDTREADAETYLAVGAWR